MNARLLLIGCGARKLHYPAPAADLYTGALLRAVAPGADAVIEIHAGAEYVRLLRTLDLQLEIADPLAGLEIGRRLQWYATAARTRGGVA